MLHNKIHLLMICFPEPREPFLSKIFLALITKYLAHLFNLAVFSGTSEDLRLLALPSQLTLDFIAIY